MKSTISNFRLVVMAAMAMLITADVASAQLRFPFRNRDADRPLQQEDLQLSEQSGPWLIMCASFSGDAGVRMAENLAEELRTKHKLKSYVFRHEFNHTERLAKSAIPTWTIDENSNSDHHIVPAEMKPATSARYEEVAVMVGDFPSVDDASAQKTLKFVKSISAESIDASMTGAEESNLSAERIRKLRHQSNAQTSNDTSGPGDFRAAFLLPNPLLPDEYFETEKVDSFVIKLNRKVKNSLLENPGVYSVRVASFQGESTFDIGEMATKEKEMKSGKRVERSKLAEAAMKAHLLTKELRKLKVDAYEFHDRHESYVCVGSFDWVSREDGEGNRTQNPAVVETILKYKGKVRNLPGRPGAIEPYTLPALAKLKIVCDAQPIPVLVPKAEKESTASKMFKHFR